MNSRRFWSMDYARCRLDLFETTLKERRKLFSGYQSIGLLHCGGSWQSLTARLKALHSMRRTEVAQINKITGNLRAVQLLLGHTKMDSTVRYLGVELEDALEISESAEI